MADNVTANPGSGGSVFRAFSDGTNEWPASVVSYVTGGSAGAWTLQQVDATHGLPVSVLGTATVSGTVTANQGGAPWSNNISQVGGSAVALGQGLMAASIPVVIASNQSAIPASQSGTWNVTVNTALPAGANTIGAVSQNGTWNVTVNTALPAGTNTIGNVAPVATTSGGATAYHLVSAATTNATSVKASAGQVYSVQCFNTNASPRYLKFFNKASAPVLGTDTPVKTIMMPGNSTGAGAVVQFPVGVAFSTGIAFAIVGGIADNDATAVGLNDCVINFDYA